MTRIQDLDLRKDILDELEWDPSIDARTIGVTVDDGIIELTVEASEDAEPVESTAFAVQASALGIRRVERTTIRIR